MSCLKNNQCVICLLDASIRINVENIIAIDDEK